MRWDGNKADKGVDVFCASSFQKDALSSSDDGNNGAEQMMQGKELPSSRGEGTNCNGGQYSKGQGKQLPVADKGVDVFCVPSSKIFALADNGNHGAEQTRRVHDLQLLQGEGANHNGGGYSGGQRKEQDGNKADKGVDVLCAPSIQKFTLSSSDNGNNEQTRRGKELTSLCGEGANHNGGGYSGGRGMQWDGNKADKGIDVFCAPSIQKDATSLSDNSAGVVQMSTKTLLSPSSLATSLSQLATPVMESFFSMFMAHDKCAGTIKKLLIHLVVDLRPLLLPGTILLWL
jgi:hypothetical protein